jgi:hypothetical protein
MNRPRPLLLATLRDRYRALVAADGREALGLREIAAVSLLRS